MHMGGEKTVADAFWSAFSSGLVILVVGLCALASGNVLLFPSLGPTAVMMAHSPGHPSSRPYNAITAHLIGLGSAFLAVALFHIAFAPSVFDVHSVSAARAGAAVLAIALSAGLEILLRATHPPAASTTLLAALGSFHPTLHDTMLVVVGLLITVGTAEPLRRYRFRQQRSMEASDSD